MQQRYEGGLMKTRHVIACACIAAISGCATGFQPHGATGGFSITALAPDAYEVVFRGNGYTTQERARDFALLEAADLTLDHGYEYFQIASANARSKMQTVYMPQYSTTTATAYGSPGYATGTAQTSTYGGFPITFNKPVVDIIVRMFHSKPADGFSFDAAFLQSSLDAKYGIKGGS